MKKFSIIKIAFGIFMAAILIIGTAAPVFAAKNNISALGSEVSNQKKYTMYLGTNDKDSQVQEIPTATIRAQMHEICMKYVSGYTVSEESKGKSTFYSGK